jgi:translation initiation factor 1
VSRPNQERLKTDGGAGLGQNPFADLSGAGLPSAPNPAPIAAQGTEPKAVPATAAPTKNRGRVEVLRTTAGRGGKTVTVAKNFVGIGLPEKEALCKAMRAAAGCGGTVKDGAIEIQGDQREVVVRVLTTAGFRAVLAGG